MARVWPIDKWERRRMHARLWIAAVKRLRNQGRMIGSRRQFSAGGRKIADRLMSELRRPIERIKCGRCNGRGQVVDERRKRTVTCNRCDGFGYSVRRKKVCA